MFDFLKLKPKTAQLAAGKQWRPNMWVIFNTEPHILHKLGEQCEIHKVDKVSGETVEIRLATLDQLRQATYDEIPAIRMGLTREEAKERGYAS